MVVRVGGGVGVGGGGCAAAAGPGAGEEAGVSGGQREAVRLDHAPQLRRALRRNGNLKLDGDILSIRNVRFLH